MLRNPNTGLKPLANPLCQDPVAWCHRDAGRSPTRWPTRTA